MPEFHLDFTNNSDECGVAFVSILVHPKDEDNDITRANLHASLCSLRLQNQAELDPNWAITPQLIKPIYALRDQKLIARDLRQFERRLRDRMVAAKIAIAFLQEVDLGSMPKLPEGVMRLSLNEMCLHVLDDVEQDDAANLETRIWRESLPVIHLATATALVFDQLEKNGLSKPSFGHLIAHPDLLRKIIEISHEHAAMLLKSTKLSIKPETLIQIYSH